MAREEWRPETLDEARALIAALKTAKLPANSVHFALSLTGQFDRKGDLSKLQWPYVRRMVNDSKPLAEQEHEVDFDGTKILAVFYRAALKIKFPNMDLHGEGIKIYLSVNSRDMKGWVIFKDSGQTHIAHVNTKGEGYFRTRCTNEQAAVVEAFAADPLGYAKMKGLAFKRCCFCGTEITTINSRYHGYGPICAENYGLPWEDVPAEARAELQAEIDAELEKDL